MFTFDVLVPVVCLWGKTFMMLWYIVIEQIRKLRHNFRDATDKMLILASQTVQLHYV